MKKLVTGLSALILAAGIGVGAASSASANAQYGCSTLSGHLHATSTLYNYSGAGTAISTSATKTYHQDVSFGVDKDWSFVKMTLKGYSTKTTNPTLWGWSKAPLNYSTKYVVVQWIGWPSLSKYYPADPMYLTCTVKVGA